MRTVLSFLGGLTMGALVGVTFALLFAPESGAEMRVKIQERAHQVRTELSEAAATRRAELKDQLAALRGPRV
jgi:gas vesicle protein